MGSSNSRTTPRYSCRAAVSAAPSIFQEKKLARTIRAAIAIGSGLAVPVANADLDCSTPANIVITGDEINQLPCSLSVDLLITPAGSLTNTVDGVIDNFATTTVNGAVDSAGDILNHNTFQIGTTGQVDLSGFFGNGAPGTSSPLLEVADGGMLHIQSGGEFSNYATAIVNGWVINDQWYFNDNTTIIGSTGSIENNFVFNSATDLDIAGTHTNSPGAFMNVWAGTVSVRDGGHFANSGSTTIYGAVTNEATFITSETGNTVVGSTGKFLNKGLSETFGILTVENGGEYNDEGSTFIRPDGQFVVAGQYLGGTSSALIVQGLTNVVSAGGKIGTEGQFDLEGGLLVEVDGLLAVKPGATLNLKSGSSLEIEGWAFLDGATSLSPGSTLINRGLTEFGFPSETNATFTTDFDSTTTNASTGVISNYGTQNINGQYVNDGTDDNYGTVNIGPTGEYIVGTGGTLNNRELIVALGALKVFGTLNDEGETRVSGDGRLELDGNYIGSDTALLRYQNSGTNAATGVIDTRGEIFVGDNATLTTTEGSSLKLDSAELTVEGVALLNGAVGATNSAIVNRNILQFTANGSALNLDPDSTITNDSQAQLTIGGQSIIDGDIFNNGNLNFQGTVFFSGGLSNQAITRNYATLWIFDGLIENDDIFQNYGAVSQFGDFHNIGFGSGLVQNLLGANWSVNNSAVYTNGGSTTNSGSFRVNSGGTLHNVDRFDNRNFMVLRSGGSATNAASGVMINSVGATLDIEGDLANGGQLLNQDGEINVADTGSVSGTGSYVQDNGFTIVDGSINLPVIEFHAGTLSGNGALTSGNPIIIGDDANVDPGGSVGSLTFDSDVMFDGTLNIEIESTASFDIVDVTGMITFGAGSEIVFDLVGYTPLAGDTFEFLTALSVSGFENALISIPGLDPSLTYSITLDGEFDLVLQYSNVPIPPTLPLLLAPIAALGFRRRARVRTGNV